MFHKSLDSRVDLPVIKTMNYLGRWPALESRHFLRKLPHACNTYLKLYGKNVFLQVVLRHSRTIAEPMDFFIFLWTISKACAAAGVTLNHPTRSRLGETARYSGTTCMDSPMTPQNIFGHFKCLCANPCSKYPNKLDVVFSKHAYIDVGVGQNPTRYLWWTSSKLTEWSTVGFSPNQFCWPILKSWNVRQSAVTNSEKELIQHYHWSQNRWSQNNYLHL